MCYYSQRVVGKFTFLSLARTNLLTVYVQDDDYFNFHRTLKKTTSLTWTKFMCLWHKL